MIYIVCEANWQDYEGGGDSIEAAFSTQEKAVAYIAQRWPLRTKLEDGEWRDPMERTSPSDQWSHIVQIALDEGLKAEKGG